MKSLLSCKTNETFNEAMETFQRSSSSMSSHGFSEITSTHLGLFYNSLKYNDQDALDSVPRVEIFLDKILVMGLAILRVNQNPKVRLFKGSRAIEPKRTLPSQTVTNPREHVNAITTRSGKTYEGPSTPLVPTPVVSTPLKEPEQNLETSMDKVQPPSSESTAQVLPPEEEDSIFVEIPKPKAKKTVNIEIQEPNSPKPTSYQPKLPYPERMKVRENDKPSAQHSQFLKMFKQLRLEIGLKDALVEMPKFYKWLSSLLRNKEKLKEIAITTVNAECSAIIMNKVPEKLKDPGKFLIPCTLQELDRTSALADSGDSNKLFYHHSIYKQLGRDSFDFYSSKTLELANRSITHPMGIAEDVVVRVDGFTFLADFVVNKQFAHAISVIDFSKDEPFSGSTTTHSDALPPSSSSVKTSDNLEEFADELTLLKNVHFQVYSNPLFEFNDNITSSNVNPLFNEMDEDNENKNSNILDSDEQVLLNTPLTDKVECFTPEDDIDEIDVFLAMEVSFNFEEGYFDSEGDVIFLENLLSDDTTHNLAPEVISDHEPEQNESLITFCPRSDPLHHEFAEEIITLPSRIASEFEEYLSLMTMLCEDYEPDQEKIDIFLVPDNLIPPGVENDDFEDEDNELPNLDHQDNQSSPRPPPEPLDVEKCLEPEAGILITKVFKVVSKPHGFMADILPTHTTRVSDLTLQNSFPFFISLLRE
ncbi:hypothetical protein Tco_0691182 [Tanacetum coccineum]